MVLENPELELLEHIAKDFHYIITLEKNISKYYQRIQIQQASAFWDNVSKKIPCLDCTNFLVLEFDKCVQDRNFQFNIEKVKIVSFL